MSLFWQEYLSFDSEIAYSMYWQDYENNADDKIDGTAYSTKLRLTTPVLFDVHRLGLETGFQETTPKFYSLSSPYANKDKRNINFTTNYSWEQLLSFNAGFTWSKDNPNDDPERVSVIQGITNIGLRLISSWTYIPDFTLNYSKNQGRFGTDSSSENFSETYNFVFNHKLDLFDRTINYNFGLQTMQFQATGISVISLLSRTVTFGAGSNINPKTLLNFAVSVGDNRNEILAYTGYTNSLSLVFTNRMLSDRLTNQVWTSWLMRNDGNISDSNFNINAESIYDFVPLESSENKNIWNNILTGLTKNLSAAAGYGFNYVSGSTSQQEHSLSIRLRYGF